MDRQPTRLFRGLLPDVDPPDVPLGRQLRAVPVVSAPAKPAVDLTGKSKVLFLIGSGNTGKSTLARVITERMLDRNPDTSTLLAALDPGERSLAHYFPDIAQPPSHDEAHMARWLDDLINHCMREKASAMVDLGGGNTSLSVLMAQYDLCAMMVEGGLEPVAFYLLGPRIDDLEQLATLEGSDFRPRATALICNAGVGDSAIEFEARFRAVRAQSVFRNAVARGAIQIAMPYLPFAAAAIEAKRLSFAQARDGLLADGTEDPAPLRGSDRSRVAHWLVAMEDAFRPIESWWPA